MNFDAGIIKLPSFIKIFRKPGPRVLILEGGGMRGIFITGLLQSFSDRDYFPWKLIIGSSAGALTGAAYAAGQIHLARDAFFTKLLGGDFIKLKNILNKEKHVLDLDWMVDTIVYGDEPFNFIRLKKKFRFLITATECPDKGAPRTIYLDSKMDDIATSLKASSAIPYMYRGFVRYKNYHLLDGGLLDPIPYKKALDLGFKEPEILVAVTRKKGYRKKEESFWVKFLYESYYKKPNYRFLVRALESRYKKYNEMLDELESKHPKIHIIYPPDEFRVERLTRDEKKLLEGFEMGVQAGKEYLLKYVLRSGKMKNS